MPSPPDYIVSLTTIPGREKEIAPTLASLAAQTVPPAEIVIYAPKRFRRPELSGAQIGGLPSYCRVAPVDDDLGPATKVLYAVRDYPGMPVIFCDDDRLYSPRMGETLLSMSERNPGACVASHALPIAQYLMQYSFKKDYAYRIRRILSLGRYKPTRIRKEARLDIVAGYGGVLVQSDQFDPGVYQIPDNYWLVDDIWLSGHLALAGTRIVSPGHELEHSEPNSPNETNALNTYVYQDMRRENLDRHCIQHFQRHHGLWLNDGGW